MADEKEREVTPEASHTHSHHHHRHHHRHHKHRTSNKFVKFLKKYKNLLVCLGVVLVAAAAIITLLIVEETRYQDLEESIQNQHNGIQISTSTIGLEVPLYAEEVRLLDDPAWACMNADATVKLNTVLEQYRKEGLRLDVGIPAQIKYEVTALPQGVSVRGARVEVADNVSFLSPRTFELTAQQNSVNVYLLKTNTQYYYRITVTLSNDTETAVQGSFRTAKSVRILSIGGTANVRDLGGWKTMDGKTIKQGLLYRGSELDGAVDSKLTLTSQGKMDMLTVLGIRTELDLRGPGVGLPEGFSANVVHKDYAAAAYDEVFTDSGKQAMRELFADLADPSTYPAYLHCTLGRDRTGTACYLLGAMLGVSEEDLIRDYELTALYYPGTTRDNLKLLQQGLAGYEGHTLQERAQNYLLSIGVTADEIASIRNILLEG